MRVIRGKSSSAFVTLGLNISFGESHRSERVLPNTTVLKYIVNVVDFIFSCERFMLFSAKWIKLNSF